MREALKTFDAGLWCCFVDVGREQSFDIEARDFLQLLFH